MKKSICFLFIIFASFSHCRGTLIERRDTIRIKDADFQPINYEVYEMIMKRAELVGKGFLKMVTNTTDELQRSSIALQYYKVVLCKTSVGVLKQLRNLLPEILSAEVVDYATPVMLTELNRTGKYCKVGIELHAMVAEEKQHRNRRAVSVRPPVVQQVCVVVDV